MTEINNARLVEILQLIRAETGFIGYIHQMATALSDDVVAGPVERTIVDTISKSLITIEILKNEVSTYSDSEVLIATLSLH